MKTPLYHVWALLDHDTLKRLASRPHDPTPAAWTSRSSARSWAEKRLALTGYKILRCNHRDCAICQAAAEAWNIDVSER